MFAKNKVTSQITHLVFEAYCNIVDENVVEDIQRAQNIFDCL